MPSEKNKEIILISRRGQKVDEYTKCSQCDKWKLQVWRYAESNQGEVHLCSACKPRIFDRSFGKIDALDVAVSGGGFETNKRKH